MRERFAKSGRKLSQEGGRTVADNFRPSRAGLSLRVWGGAFSPAVVLNSRGSTNLVSAVVKRPERLQPTITHAHTQQTVVVMPASASQDRFALHPEEQELWTCPLKAQNMGHRLLGLLSWGHNAPSPLFIEQHHPIHFVETAQPSITHTMVQSMNRRAREKKNVDLY